MNRTPLYDTHVRMGARMVPFAGYEMPVQYVSPLEEHHTVRRAAGLFDIDHMGQVIVAGPEAGAFLQYITPGDVLALSEWEAGYNLLCYPHGGTVDDIFIYRQPDRFYVVINAANREKDIAWMKEQASTGPFRQVTIQDISDETCMLAFQGPQAQPILQRLADFDLGEIEFHHSRYGKVAGVDCYIGSTGYTGEYGYELFFDAAQAVKVWEGILEAGQPEGAAAIGLAARDSLRFEPCLPLYGHELSEDITPVEAGLGLFVKPEKGDFIGREALAKQKSEGAPRRLACLEMIEKAVPREHYPVKVGEAEGFVTTGMYAPTLDAYLAMALIPTDSYGMGHEVEVIIRDKPKKAKIVKRPFYKPAYRR